MIEYDGAAPAGKPSVGEALAEGFVAVQAFLKTKCAECGGSCGLAKKYRETMSARCQATQSSCIRATPCS